MFGTVPSSTGGVLLIPGRGAKIPHASQPKNQNIKPKQSFFLSKPSCKRPIKPRVLEGVLCWPWRPQDLGGRGYCPRGPRAAAPTQGGPAWCPARRSGVPTSPQAQEWVKPCLLGREEAGGPCAHTHVHALTEAATPLGRGTIRAAPKQNRAISEELCPGWQLPPPTLECVYHFMCCGFDSWILFSSTWIT